MLEKLVIIGAGRGADLVVRYFRDGADRRPSAGDQAYDIKEIVAILDDNTECQGRMGIPYRGTVEALATDFDSREFAICISISTYMDARRRIYEWCKERGYTIVNVLRSNVSRCQSVGDSNLIFPDVHFGLYSEIGNNNIISAGSIVPHHNRIGSHNLLGPGCMLSGSVTIGDDCIVGSGVVIERRVVIGSNVKIASGSVITGDIPDNSYVRAVVRPNCLQVHQGDRRVSPVRTKQT